MSKGIFFALALIFLGYLPLGHADSRPFRLNQVANGVYVHEGAHSDVNLPGYDDIANIGFIVGSDCVAVIDTGGSIDIGQRLMSAIREITHLPICYVINTHVHFDHVLGNLAFRQESPEFVGHQRLPDAIEQNRDFFLQQFNEGLGPVPSRESIIGPSLTVDKTMELDLGDRMIRLTAYPPAHSYADLTVFDHQTKTLWTGDLVVTERIPILDGRLKGWLPILEALQNQNINLAISGHGAAGSDWRQAYSLVHTYLKKLLVGVRKAIADGLFLEEAIDSIGKNEHQDWLLYEQYHKRNVSKAFTELEWE